MRTAGVEPAPRKGQDPKSCASASFATFAQNVGRYRTEPFLLALSTILQ